MRFFRVVEKSIGLQRGTFVCTPTVHPHSPKQSGFPSQLQSFEYPWTTQMNSFRPSAFQEDSKESTKPTHDYLCWRSCVRDLTLVGTWRGSRMTKLHRTSSEHWIYRWSTLTTQKYSSSLWSFCLNSVSTEITSTCSIIYFSEVNKLDEVTSVYKVEYGRQCPFECMWQTHRVFFL